MDTASAGFAAVAAFIEEQGHTTTLVTSDIDTNIHSVDFRSKGLNFRVTMSDEDPEFFSVGLSFNISDRAPARERLIQVAHDIAAAQKATKIEVDARGVIFLRSSSFSKAWRASKPSSGGALARSKAVP